MTGTDRSMNLGNPDYSRISDLKLVIKILSVEIPPGQRSELGRGLI